MLPRVRSFCAEHQDIFHYEVERVDQVGDALKTIARVQPTVLVINGGDGTVQAALTEIFNGGYFGDNPPPVAVLPNGKTNLIAHDLGASGDPIVALERVLEIARSDLDTHIVRRELIELSGGTADGKPVLGMFLGGAGLADTMLYCRHKIYPLGLPNGIAHFIALMLGLFSAAGGKRISVGPMRSNPLRVSVLKQGEINGQFSVLLVTTLQRLLFGTQMSGSSARLGAMQLVLIDRSILALLRALTAGILGKLGRIRVSGVHLERGDEIHIQGEQSNVILDGELFSAEAGQPIVLKPTPPVPFLRLAV